VRGSYLPCGRGGRYAQAPPIPHSPGSLLDEVLCRRPVPADTGMKKGGQVLLGGLHVKVSRNFFGSQVRIALTLRRSFFGHSFSVSTRVGSSH
jgi:hypothetical protein